MCDFHVFWSFFKIINFLQLRFPEDKLLLLNYYKFGKSTYMKRVQFLKETKI